MSCEAVHGKFVDSEPDSDHVVTEIGDKQVVSNEQADSSGGEDEVPKNVTVTCNGGAKTSDKEVVYGVDVNGSDGDQVQESNAEGTPQQQNHKKHRVVTLSLALAISACFKP